MPETHDGPWDWYLYLQTYHLLLPFFCACSFGVFQHAILFYEFRCSFFYCHLPASYRHSSFSWLNNFFFHCSSCFGPISSFLWFLRQNWSVWLFVFCISPYQTHLLGRNRRQPKKLSTLWALSFTFFLWTIQAIFQANFEVIHMCKTYSGWDDGAVLCFSALSLGLSPCTVY